jgi:RNA polymerase sigma-70 factor (ECF subfamily)
MNTIDASPNADTTNAAQLSLVDAFASYHNELLGALYLLVGDREDALDALQDAFVKCWRHRHAAPGVRNLKAWIFRITLNTGRDVRKAAWRRRRKPLPLKWTCVVSVGADPQTVAQQDEETARIRHAVDGLRREEREVFLLRQDGDLTYEQIAETLSIPTGTVKTRMRLALAKLRAAPI